MAPMRAVLATLAVVAALATRAHAAQAQRVSSTLDLGGASIRYAGALTATAAVATPAFGVLWPRASLGTSASFSRFSSGGVSTQGSFTASGYTPSVGPFTGELAGLLGGSAHQDGTRTRQFLATGRVHMTGRALGAWVGGGAGRMSDGVVWRGVRVAEAGAWTRFDEATLQATATPTIVDDSIRYTDLEAALGWRGGNVELAATAGARTGAHLPALGGTATSWGSASAVLWLTSHVALVVSGGSYPVDLRQGFPGGQFATLSVRFGSRSARPSASEAAPVAARAADALEHAASVGASAFTVTALPDGRRSVRVRATGARSMEIMGDFTEWRPVTLTPAEGGWWTTVVEMAPGTHQVNLRVNGAVWLVPPGLLTARDEFGGSVGLLVIEK